MIIKGLRKQQDSDIASNWEYIDNVTDVKIFEPTKLKVGGGYDYSLDKVTFNTNGTSREIKIFEYDKLFLMNDNGKTLETLRNVDRNRYSGVHLPKLL